MPLLLNGAHTTMQYGQTYQTFAIIDHEGFIRFKTTFLIPMDELRDEVVLALADLPPIEEEVVETVETTVETSEASTPQTFSLAQNAPNPFNGETVIRFALPQPSQVELTIYNLLGQPVAVLAQGLARPGHSQCAGMAATKRAER